jgi:exosortase
LRGLPWIAWANLVGLGSAALGVSALLWPQWCHDENLTHGLLLPLLSLILLFEARRDPAPRFLAPGAGTLAACLVLAAVGLCFGLAAVVYAEELGWTHATAEFMAAMGLVCVLGAGLVAGADGRVALVPFSWASVAACLLWGFASPPPPGTYARLSSFLQGGVTHGVVRTLVAAGIAAHRDGNVIELARTNVGVSEACSGVRSLISCTVAGLFLSALLVRKPAGRALVIVLSPLLGLAMNFVRSLVLTLVANAGVGIEGAWHDLTGASIIVVTTLLLAATAFGVNRWEGPEAEGTWIPAAPARSTPAQGVVASALALALCGALLFGRGAPGSAGPESVEPDLVALLPQAPEGWVARTTPGLEQYSDVLKTRALVERVYMSGVGPGAEHLVVYLAHWKPGQASVSEVDLHTPDACWPGTGWEPVAARSTRASLPVGGRVLPPSECRLFAHGGLETHVWFWHLYGGRPIPFVDPRSALRLLRLALRYGFKGPSDQLFVCVSSNRTWDEVAAEPAVQKLFENLRPMGL